MFFSNVSDELTDATKQSMGIIQYMIKKETDKKVDNLKGEK